MKLTRLLALAWLLAAFTLPVSAQTGSVRLTLDPTMVKGPPTASVTIVEFSDYQ